jgi:hypothetical protein
MRWLESQALALFRQGRFKFSQGRASTNAHHQLAGLVTDDASQWRYVKHFTLQGFAIEVFAALSAKAQGGFVSGSSANAVNEGIEYKVHKVAKVSDKPQWYRLGWPGGLNFLKPLAAKN